MAPEFDGHETSDGYLDTELAPMFDSYDDMLAFMRVQFPPLRKPKEIKHVILDADDTIWEIDPWGIASLAKPIGKTEGDVLPAALETIKVKNLPKFWGDIVPTGTIKLDPKLRTTLDQLKERGIPVSIASNNDKKAVERYLNAFGLRDKITDIEANWYTPKDEMLRNIAQRNKLDLDKVLFVDDSAFNCQDVALHTAATPLLLGYNIDSLDEILELIK